MLHNYLKIALRNIWKNKLYFGINVMGLGIALACSIIAYLNYAFDQSFDTFHEKRENIYRVNMIRQSNGVEYGLAPLPLGPAAERDIPGISSCVRVEYQQAAVKQGETVLSESVQFADPGFFQLFDFPLLAGSYEALSNNIKWLLLFQALVAILLALTGLFAMVSLNVLKRLKEIAIRRIVGARARDIAFLINKNYLWIFAVAAVLGVAGGAVFAWKLMDSIFAIHAGLHSGMMAGAAFGVVFLALGTISLKVFGVLRVRRIF